MKNNIVIFGSSRSGKTTLAKIISKEYNYNYVSIDRIVSAFQDGMPHLGISHDDKSGQTIKLFSPFILNYIKNLNSSKFKRDDIYFVIEGCYIDIDAFLTFFREKDIKLIILIQPQLSKNEFYENIRKYDPADEWTARMSDEELLKYCDNLIVSNNRIKDYCEANNIEYYDVSYNREETYNKIIKELEKLNDF